MYLTDQVKAIYAINPEMFNVMVEKYIGTLNEVTILRQREAENQPYTILGRTVIPQKGSITFQSAAQMLAQHGVAIGQNRLYRYCREKKYLCLRKGRQWNRPTQKAIEAGLFGLEISGGFHAVPVITPLGMKELSYALVRETYPLLMMMEEV